MEKNDMKDQHSIVVVGKLGSAYGIKGWLKLHSFTEVSEDIFKYNPWYIQSNHDWNIVCLEDWKKHGKSYIVKLRGIDVREDVQYYSNLNIGVNSNTLPTLSDSEFYWLELVGMDDFTTKNYHLGKVSEILETGSNDVLVIKANVNDAFNKKERLIPFIEEQVIKFISRKDNKIEVDWEPGF